MATADLYIRPLLSQSLADGVYQALRAAILSQEVAPDERLHVDELAARLGVSKTPVKEALIRLRSAGLIRIVPRRGTFVASLSIKEVVETHDVRKVLEAEACRRLIRARDSRRLVEMQRMNRELRAARSRDGVDVERHLQMNFAFHETLIKAHENDRLLEIYRDLRLLVQIARIHHVTPAWLDRLDREEREHAAILTALSAWDEAAAVEAVSSHLEGTLASLVTDMRDAQKGAPGLLGRK